MRSASSFVAVGSMDDASVCAFDAAEPQCTDQSDLPLVPRFQCPELGIETVNRTSGSGGAGIDQNRDLCKVRLTWSQRQDRPADQMASDAARNMGHRMHDNRYGLRHQHSRPIRNGNNEKNRGKRDNSLSERKNRDD